jgi:hypothetical protein
MNKKLRRKCLLASALIIPGSLVLGCKYFPEATFKLAGDSRLPKWITLPPAAKRKDVEITMSYYIKPWGSNASFTLQNDKHVIQQIDGKLVCTHPFSLKGSKSDYPSYEAVVVSGTTELIEHKKMEPTFYVTDDAAVWKYYSANGCG